MSGISKFISAIVVLLLLIGLAFGIYSFVDSSKKGNERLSDKTTQQEKKKDDKDKKEKKDKKSVEEKRIIHNKRNKFLKLNKRNKRNKLFKRHKDLQLKLR